MRGSTNSLVKTSVPGFRNAARTQHVIAAHRNILGRAHVRARTKHLWISNMDQRPTERPANTAMLEVPLPPEFPAAFQRLVDARNQVAERGRKRIYACHLYQEAIGELIHLAGHGRVTFIATPFRSFVRKMFWVDQPLREWVEHFALAHGITRSAVVVTAFQLYLDLQGALREPANMAET